MAIGNAAAIEAEIAALDTQIAASRGGAVTQLPTGLALAQPPLAVLEAVRSRLLLRLRRLNARDAVAASEGSA